MHIKRDTKTRGGKAKTYLSLAHNVRKTTEGTDGRKKHQTTPVIFAHLGAEEDLDRTFVEGALAALQRYAEKRWGPSAGSGQQAVRVEEAAVEVRRNAPVLRLLCHREFGMRLLLAKVWEDLGIQEALSGVEAGLKITFPFERLVFGMVFNRIIDPLSKLACNDWLRDQAFFPEWDKDWGVHHFYRTLDRLEAHWEQIEEALFQALWERTPEELRVAWLTDTTSLYFEARMDDEERAEIAKEWEAFNAGLGEKPIFPEPQVVNEPPMKMAGHNKDGHPGDPQVVVASVCLANGVVLRHRTYPGNTNDTTIAKDLIETMPTPPGVTRIWVSDGGMVSPPRLKELDDLGWHRLTADPPKSSKLAMGLLLPQPGRYIQHPTREQYSYRLMDLAANECPSGRAERFLVVRNLWDRTRQLKKIDKHLAWVRDALSVREPDGTHSKAVCKVVTHPSLKRYVRPSDKVKGRYVLDQDSIRQEQTLAGTRVYRTTLQGWDPVEMFDSYQLLQEVEANHKEMKGPLRLRPCYHRSSHRIRAHVMLVILAVNCVRVLEEKTGRSIAELRKIFNPLMASEVEEDRERRWQRTELTVAQGDVLTKLGIPLPPQTWALWSDGSGDAAMVR